jgi:quaternary ammonium compound-resistance protein SugE
MGRGKMEWIYIFIAGIFEVSWAIGLKYSEGWTKTIPNIFTVVTMLLSLYFLSKGLKVIPVGTAYAVWTGIGAAGTAILGIFLFNESRDVGRLFFIFLIVVGIIGLKLKS